MKTASYFSASLVYLVVWLFCGFSIGMSHSVPYYKFEKMIYQYFYLIMLGELFLFILLSYFFIAAKKEFGEVLSYLMAIGLSADFGWKINEFTQYGYGYRYIEKIIPNETLMVILVNLSPIVLLCLCIGYREKIGKALFGNIVRKMLIDPDKKK